MLPAAPRLPFFLSSLIAPAAVFTTAAEQRAPRLLAGTVLALVAALLPLEAYLVLTLSAYRPPWPGYLALATIYALSRTRHYRAGGGLFAMLFTVVAWSQVALGVAAEPAVTLSFMSLGPLVCALFVSLRAVPALGAVNVGAIALLPVVSSAAPGGAVLFGAAVLSLIATALAFLSSYSRRQAERDRERALRADEERLRFALEAANLGHWEVQVPEGTSQISSRVAEILGIDPSDWKGDRDGLLEVVHPDDRPMVAEKLMAAGSPETARHRVVRPDGSVRWVEVRARALAEEPGRVIGTLEDVTQQREIEEQLRQSQKMEAVGRLAGGVAHDFNNLLTVVMGNVELMQQAETSSELDEIAKAARSARGLTSRLLAFSRQSEFTLESVDFGLVLKDAVGMAQRVLGESIDVRLDCPTDLWTVSADVSQVQHALLNLANNARDAMPSGGRLRVVARNDPGSGDEGNGVTVAISDDGVGIAESDREKIFDPFFTTKARGKGTGLGLSMVRSMMDRVGGTVTVESRSGQGTTFTLRFARATPGAPASAMPPSEEIARGGTVLLVEDDGSVRRLCQRTLQHAGYDVIVTESAEQALERWVACRPLVALLLSDVVMPGVNGPELAARLREDRPELPVLLMSGYAPEDDVELGQANRDFIAKPFGGSELVERVGKMLVRKQAGVGGARR